MLAEKLRRMQAACALLLASLASGCVTTHAYEVRLDASHAANHELCTTRVDAMGQGKTECEKLAGQTLNAPGTLAVKLTGTTAQEKYELRVEQNVQSAEGPSTERILNEVLARVQQLASGYVTGLDPAAPASDTTLSVKRVFDAISKNIEAARPALAKTLSELSMPAAAPLRPSIDPKKAYRHWLEKPPAGASAAGKFKDTKPAFDSPEDQVFGSPSAFYVPVRLVDFDAELLRYLVDEQRISLEQLADFTLAWCDPASFGKNPYDGAPWESFALEKFVDQKAVLDALGLGADVVDAVVKGGAPPALKQTIERLLQEAFKSQLAHQAVTGAARVAHSLHAGAALNRDMQHCSANLAFLANDATLAAKRGAALKTTSARVEALERATKPAADTFQIFLAPLLEKTLLSYLNEQDLGDGARSFGTFSLRAGNLGLGLQRQEGTQRVPLAELDFKVEEASPVAVAVGPVVMLCDECVSTVSERTSLGTDASGQPVLRRELAQSKSSAGIGYGVMVHYSLLRRASHHVGLSLGYPLRDQTGTAFSILFGPSYRNTLGFQLSAGVQLFQATRVRDGVSLPVDTSNAATSTLTASDVTEKTVKAAAFLFAGLSSDSF